MHAVPSTSPNSKEGNWVPQFQSNVSASPSWWGVPQGCPQWKTKHSPRLPPVLCFEACKHYIGLNKASGSGSKDRVHKHRKALKDLTRFEIQHAFSILLRTPNFCPFLSIMYPSAWRNSLWLLTSMAALAHCSVEFFIDQEYDRCSRDNNGIACRNNTDRGGLCAYAPDANMLWCCPAPDQCVQCLINPLRRKIFTQKELTSCLTL